MKKYVYMGVKYTANELFDHLTDGKDIIKFNPKTDIIIDDCWYDGADSRCNLNELQKFIVSNGTGSYEVIQVEDLCDETDNGYPPKWFNNYYIVDKRSTKYNVDNGRQWIIRKKWRKGNRQVIRKRMNSCDFCLKRK